MDTNLALERPVYLTREGDLFKLVFEYDQALVERCHQLYYATYDGTAWYAEVCAQNVDMLRAWFSEGGLTDVSVDELVAPDETLAHVAAARLRPGRASRPYSVQLGTRVEGLYQRLHSLPGAKWEKASHSLTYPSLASVALAEMVKRGVVEDPSRLLTPADITVAFDGRSGKFSVRGDERAQVAFDRLFPGRDVVGTWKDKGFDVAFADGFSEEVYRGEMARVGGGLQPEGFKIALFPYQAQNVAVGVERNGIGVLDAPGLGKTATAIAWGHELMENRQEAGRTVVVVPGAVRTQWAREIARFTGLETDKKGMPLSGVTVIDGDKKKRTKLYEEAKSSRWVILNYDLLALDYKLIAPLVAGSLLVADEAHRLKSPTAKRTKAMRDLAARASRRMALSGTPVENNPGEWYNVLSGFAVPGVFGSPTEFLSRYQYPNRWGGYEGARNLGELRERSRVHYVRHTKAEVATHLPPLRVQHTPIDPEPSYMSALKRAHREARDEIAQAAQDRAGRYLDPFDAEAWEEVQTGADMTAVGMLRLLCLSPRLVVESDSESARALCESGLVPEVDGPKLDELRTMAGEMQSAGERVVVFTFSKKMADLISTRFTEDGIRHVTFTGADSSSARDDAVLAFTSAPTEEDPGPTVFVATDAGAEGLNLGKQCSTLVNLDIPWTPGRFEQRSNRIHRLDGTAPHYLVRNMTLKGTLEEGILRMVEQKADLVDAIFGEAGGRTRTTGRAGRSIFEEALSEWGED
jgi:SNF2 family DNA or RNA helicase